MSTPRPELDAALGLERLRGELREGLARIEGALSLLVLRSEQSEKAQAVHADRLARHETRIDAIEAAQQKVADLPDRVRAVERRLWAIGGGLAVVTGAAELIVYAIR